MILTNKDLKMPEEYKDLPVQIGVDKNLYPVEGFTEDQVRAIIERFYKAGMIITSKDESDNK
jgi:hypothetical protein